MNKDKWVKKNKWILIWAVLSIAVAFVVHCLFKMPQADSFFQASWTAGEILTYISTVSLGLLAMWQNRTATEENGKILKQQMRQNIGYFELKRSESKVLIYQDLQVGQYLQSASGLKENTLAIGLKNVGTDVIISPQVLVFSVNDKEVACAVSCGMIFKGEKIFFETDLSSVTIGKKLKIKMKIKMKNLSGISYYEDIEITANDIGNRTYRVCNFNPKIYFDEDCLGVPKTVEDKGEYN